MKIMIYDAPGKLRLAEIEDFSISETQVRIRSMYSGISHGTEMTAYRGVAPFFDRVRDPETGLFLKADKSETWSFPVRSCDPGVWYMGYANVGEIIEVGAKVTNVKLGDIVFTQGPHQTQVIYEAEDVLKLPEGVKPEWAVVFANLITAHTGVIDADINVGDTVVVSGLGVIGQLLVQLAKMNGAFRVYGIDMFEKRRQVALENGCDAVFNPADGEDIALKIRQLTENRGPDVVFEASGNHRALNEAIRICAPNRDVVITGWHQGELKGVDLSGEFHHNKIRLTKSSNVRVETSLMWPIERRRETCLELLRRLRIDNLLTDFVDYDDVVSAYEIVDQHPENSVQVVIRY